MNHGIGAQDHESWRAGAPERPEKVFCEQCYQKEVV